MTINEETTGWGIVYHYKNSSGGFALYVYNDDNDAIYLSNLNVRKRLRGNGHGNELLQIINNEARKYNRKEIYLKVLTDSWMHNWYKRHGYNDVFKDDVGYTWMKNHLSVV